MSSVIPLNIPQPPMPLTTGMPDPATISKQKDAYNKMLEEQLKQGITVLDAQVKHQKDYLVAQADQQKKQFTMQIEMEVRQQEMALQQQYAEQSMALQQQASQQKAALEQQAMQLTMDYQQKKAEETMQKQQYEMERQQTELQSRMQAEMQKLGVATPYGQPFQVSQSIAPFANSSSLLQTQAPGQTYVYGPNGELVLKDEFQQAQAQQQIQQAAHQYTT